MYLGIETSSLVSSVALMEEGKLLGELTVQSGLTHSEQLVPHIQLLCQQVEASKEDIEGVVVATGPGSFTGLRIGMGTAKALAYAWQCPLYGVMTMDGLAYNLPFSERIISVVIDAQKKNVYEARYQAVKGKIQQISPPQVKAADDLVAELVKKQENVVFLGDGIKRLKSSLKGYGDQFLLAPSTLQIPRAGSLLLAAQELIETGASEDPMTMVPFYIRRSEAEVVWEEKHGREAASKPENNPSVLVFEAAEQGED